MEDITDADYAHAKIFCKIFERKSLGEHHDLYVKAIPYCWLMYLRTFKISILKYTN